MFNFIKKYRNKNIDHEKVLSPFNKERMRYLAESLKRAEKEAEEKIKAEELINNRKNRRKLEDD